MAAGAYRVGLRSTHSKRILKMSNPRFERPAGRRPFLFYLCWRNVYRHGSFMSLAYPVRLPQIDLLIVVYSPTTFRPRCVDSELRVPL